MLERKSSDTLIKTGSITNNTGNSMEIDRYQRLVGVLIYFSHTRPDITFAVSLVSKHMHSPKEAHPEAVYKILMHLRERITQQEAEHDQHLQFNLTRSIRN